MSASPTPYVFQVPVSLEQVPLARRHSAHVLDGWGLDAELVFTAGLIVTELVSNVVRHAAEVSFVTTVSLAVEHGELVLAVHDSHPSRPRALARPYGAGGRGLALVKALAEEFGGSHHVLPDPESAGKQIVIRLPLDTSAPAGPTACVAVVGADL